MTRVVISRPAAVAASAIALAAVTAATPALAVPLQWASFSTSNSGTVNGVGFTITNMAEACCNGGTSLGTLDLNGADWGGLGNQQGRLFNQNSTTTFTVTFAAAITDLRFYLYYFRGGSVDGYNSYDFGQSFSIVSGLSAPVTQTGTTLDTSSVLFASGVIGFSGAVTSITVTATGVATGGDAGLTFTGFAAPVPGGAGLLVITATAPIRRRRR